MPQTHGSWLRSEINSLWAARKLFDEPTSNLVALVHGLAHDDDAVDRTDLSLMDRVAPNGAVFPGLITKVAKAWAVARKVNNVSPKRMRSWRVRGYPFDVGYMPASPLLKPRRPDPTDTAYVAWLWPFAEFFRELSSAIKGGAHPKDPPWNYRLEEVCLILLLTNAVDGGEVLGVLTGLKERVLKGTKKRLDGDVMADVLERWVGRKAPVRSYNPKARSMDDAASRAYQYVRGALLRNYKREAKRRRALVPPQTEEGWQREGIEPPRTILEVQRIRTFKRQHQKHLGDLPNQKAVAKHLGCSRATVQKYTPKAVKMCDVAPIDEGVGIAKRYPKALVDALARLIVESRA